MPVRDKPCRLSETEIDLVSFKIRAAFFGHIADHLHKLNLVIVNNDRSKIGRSLLEADPHRRGLWANSIKPQTVIRQYFDGGAPVNSGTWRAKHVDVEVIMRHLESGISRSQRRRQGGWSLAPAVKWRCRARRPDHTWMMRFMEVGKSLSSRFIRMTK